MPRGNGGIIGPVNTSFSGVWSLTEAQLRRSANTWPNFYASLLSESATGSDVFSGADAADPYFEYTTLLLPGNGTNGAQNNTFLDGSTNNFTITRNGNTTQGTFSPFSQTGWGNYFNGTSGYLTASDAGFVATGDFTVETWVYGTLTGAYQGIFSTADATDTAGFRLSIINTNYLEFWINGSSNASTAYVFNQWNHIAMVRSGSGSNNVSCYFNGTRVAQLTNTSSTTNSLVALGRYRTGGTNQYWLGGYLSNARLVTGAALYSGTTITVPTSPLSIAPSGTTQLLTCQSNRFIDNSSTPKTITVNGTVTVQAFSPFNPTASWSAATYGGSGYFDGSGDYLQIPTNTAFNLGTGAFCVEFWVYITSLAEQPSFINNNSTNIFYETSGSNRGLCLYASAAAQLTSSTTALPLNAWNHVVICRNTTGTLSSFANGNRLATAASNTSTVDFSNAIINRYFPSVAGHLFGYTSDLRMVKGSTPYDPTLTTCTVPTAPLTAITNTSLLLNFTNAGIYDATSKNDLETVGNAQISNTTAKWGSTSIKFDGTGDYLSAASTSRGLEMLTGDFTIECWIRFNVVGNGQIVTGLAAANTIYWQYYTSQLAFGQNNVANIAATNWSPSSGVWYYIAVTRSGSTVRQFVDGTQLGSNATSSASFPNGPIQIGDGGAGGFNGYIQDLRITKGYARYTANFTPPTAAFPTL